MASHQPVRPQVVAHRGASHDDAEHTLGAYLKALDQGAEALECDVRLTADGHLVCFHDRDLRRTGSSRGYVSTMDLADLEQLDFAAWKNPWADLDDEAEEADASRGRMLTMRRLMEVVADYDRRVELAIETKHPTRYAGLVERRLAELLDAFGWTAPGSPVRVMSFSYSALHRMERLAPSLPLVMLIDKRRHWPMLQGVVGDDWILGPGVHLLHESPAFADRLRATGRDLHVWTVNSEADLDACLRHGVSAVITDRPGHLHQLLDHRGLARGD